MKALTMEAIHRVMGPVDDQIAAEIAASGASEEELREARAWVENDEPLIDEHRHLPQGRVAELIEILRPPGWAEDERDA